MLLMPVGGAGNLRNPLSSALCLYLRFADYHISIVIEECLEKNLPVL
jgi:hypothetical protein